MLSTRRARQFVVSCAIALCRAAAEQDLDLILYGATGCVGHFAAAHLAAQEGLRWAVAGRNATELQSVVEELKAAGGPSSHPEVIVASLDGKHDPAEWVKRSRAVITAAGPFSAHGGEQLVAACARLGVHYADTSDEFYWQREMIDGYHEAALASGAKIVLASGFCAMAGDLGGQLALSRIPEVSDAETHVDEWLETYNGGVSAGVIHTFHTMQNASFPKEWNTDPYVLAPHSRADLRADESASVSGLGTASWDWSEGPVVQNVFGPYDARLLRRTFTDLGQRVHFRSGAPPSMYTKWTAFLAARPGSWTSLTKCPTPEVYKDGSWKLRVHATAGKKSASLLLSGSGDPGYRFTSTGLAEAGLCLAGKIQGCMREDSKGGVMTTMVALEPSVVQQRLESIDLLKVDAMAASDTAILM